MPTHSELDWNVNPQPRKKACGDINSPGYSPGRKKEEPAQSEINTGVESETGTEPQKPTEPEIRFTSAKFEPHPMNGYEPNKECIITGTAEFLKKTVRTKCTLELFASFADHEEDLNLPEDKYGTAFIENDGSFTFSAVPLYLHSQYPNKQQFTEPVTYKGRVSAERHEKPWKFSIDLPVEGNEKPPLLKRGLHDDKAVEKYPSKYSKGADGYLSGTPVYEFQRVMEDFKYLPANTANGVFGPKTEEAAKAFQKDSQGRSRVSRKTGKLVEASSVTYESSVDGIVGPGSRDEIAVWKRENYQRPAPALYHGDFDREGVSRGRGKRDAEEYHDAGDPVVEAQKTLSCVDAYDGEPDGWFWDKMQGGIKLFQEYAEKGQFIMDGVLTDIGEKLSGHVKGVWGPETKAFAEKVVEKKGKVPKKEGLCIKLGDKGEIVEEINIRLAGFAGGIPSEKFDNLTEKRVKKFQRDYMKLEKPTGIVDDSTLKGIDEFCSKFPLDMQAMRCPCGSCSGFGKGRKKGEYKHNVKQEKFHFYEYPGIHRSLLNALRAAMFYYSEKLNPELSLRISSGYRCYTRMEQKDRYTCNHLGKALDIHIYEKINGKWVREADKRANYSDELRKHFETQCEANVNWTQKDALSMEPNSLAKTWVHLDVREFTASYLRDKHFSKNEDSVKKLEVLAKG